MTGFDNLDVDLSVVLGKTRMPLQQLLRLGRGAVVGLEGTESDLVEILANGHLIAEGQVVVSGTSISVEVTRMVKKPLVLREPGTKVGGDMLRYLLLAGA